MDIHEEKILANKEKGEDQKDDTQKQTSVPLNKTPPAPPEKTKPANFAESNEGLTIFVQAESASDDKKE